MTAQAATTPRAEVAIDATLVQNLLRSQHPDLASLPIGARREGWDNALFRLGGDLVVRLPRRQAAADQVGTELDWLPSIGRAWPFAAPIPVRHGSPALGYPWRWSVVPWIEGLAAYRVPLSTDGVAQLADALRAVHRPASTDAPRNPHRSGSLITRLDLCEKRARALSTTGPSIGWHVDLDAARRVLVAGAREPRPGPTWTHLDLHGNNILVKGGKLAGIIDWGDAGAGDPATDLGQAMALVGVMNWDVLLARYGAVDGATFKRARAEALYFALTLASTGEEPYLKAGWQALADVGVARRSST